MNVIWLPWQKFIRKDAQNILVGLKDPSQLALPISQMCLFPRIVQTSVISTHWKHFVQMLLSVCLDWFVFQVGFIIVQLAAIVDKASD